MSEYIISDEQLAENQRLHGKMLLVLRGIVRCRDCIYYMQDPNPIDPGWPMMCERTGDDMVEPYGFCWRGERKEGGDD